MHGGGVTSLRLARDGDLMRVSVEDRALAFRSSTARDPDRVPFDLLAPPEYSATTVVAPTEADVVYLVRDQRLAPVVRDVLPLDPSTLIDALVKGPTSEETAAGLRSAITDAAVIDHVEQGVDDVTISFSDAFSELAPADQLVAMAQLTYTLTELSGVERVGFLRGDEPLAVPRPDGTVSDGPVTRSDFATLAP